MRRGFTLIELLVVIAIIGLLASVTLASLESTRTKAENARRRADMNQIMLALQLFYDDNGCLPRPGSNACAPGDSNSGGWDYSSQGESFLPFLEAAGYFTSTPVDPINDMTGDGSPPGTYAYRYYCYFPGQSAHPPGGLHLGYWERGNTYIIVSSPNGLWGNTDFNCI